MKFFIIWLVSVAAITYTLTLFSTRNIARSVDDRPRLIYKQVAFDGIAFTMLLLCFPFLLLAGFYPLADRLSVVLDYEEPYVFSFLILVVLQAMVFTGLHYLTAFIQEVCFVRARDRYEVKRKLVTKKEGRKNLDDEVENLIKEYELSGRELRATDQEETEKVLKVLHAEDINEGVAELDKIVEFPIDKAK